MEEIGCKIVSEPEIKTKTIIGGGGGGGGDAYGKRPLFVGRGFGSRIYSCGNCNLVLADNVSENMGLVNVVLICPEYQSYNKLP